MIDSMRAHNQYGKVSVLSASEFFHEIQNSKENQNAFEDFKYLYPDCLKDETSLVLKDKNKIIAVAGLQENPYNRNMIWMKHISVHSDYQNQKCAKTLVQAIFDFCKSNNYHLHISTYTEDGEMFLKHIFDYYRQRYEIPFTSEN